MDSLVLVTVLCGYSWPNHANQKPHISLSIAFMAFKQKWRKCYAPSLPHQTMFKFLWKPWTPVFRKEEKGETVLPVFHHFPLSLFDSCRSVLCIIHFLLSLFTYLQAWGNFPHCIVSYWLSRWFWSVTTKI